MADEHVEVILTLKNAGDDALVTGWFKEKGISVTQMRRGLLLSGGSQDFRRVLGHSDSQFTIPDELDQHVASITRHRPPTLA